MLKILWPKSRQYLWFGAIAGTQPKPEDFSPLEIGETKGLQNQNMSIRCTRKKKKKKTHSPYETNQFESPNLGSVPSLPAFGAHCAHSQFLLWLLKLKDSWGAGTKPSHGHDTLATSKMEASRTEASNACFSCWLFQTSRDFPGNRPISRTEIAPRKSRPGQFVRRYPVCQSQISPWPHGRHFWLQAEGWSTVTIG